MFLLDAYLFKTVSLTRVFEYCALHPIFPYKPCGFYGVTWQNMMAFMMRMLGSIELAVHLCSKTPIVLQRGAAQCVINHRDCSETCARGLRTTAHRALGI